MLKAISDAGWRTLLTLLQQKDEMHGHHAEISARSFEYALVRNTDHTFLGEYESYDWTPVKKRNRVPFFFSAENHRRHFGIFKSEGR